MSESLPSLRAHYADLFERILDPIYLLDAESWVIQDANSAAERILEKSREELIGKSILSWVEESFLEELEKNLRIVSRRYYPKQLQLKWKNKDQDIRFMEVQLSTLDLEDGLKTIQVMMKDITHQVEAAEKEKAYLKKLEELNQKLAELSSTDEMTQLANFRTFKQHHEAEHTRSQRYGNAYTVIFCDVDNFKHYNDRNGHPAGDALLRQLGVILRKEARTTDLPARYGGEEFAVICPETAEKDALNLAERIRASVQNFPFEHASSQPLGFVSISIGVASFQSKSQSAADVLAQADEATYHSKTHGKNQVTAASTLKKEKAAA